MVQVSLGLLGLREVLEDVGYDLEVSSASILKQSIREESFMCAAKLKLFLEQTSTCMSSSSSKSLRSSFFFSLKYFLFGSPCKMSFRRQARIMPVVVRPLPI